MSEGQPRKKEHLPISATVLAMAARLGERADEPRRQIARAVAVLGEDAVWAFIAEAEAMEAAGGMLRRNGTPRTLGGIFFWLMDSRVTPLERFLIAAETLIPKTAQRVPERVAETAAALEAVVQELVVGLGITDLSQRASLDVMVPWLGRARSLEGLALFHAVEARGGMWHRDGRRRGRVSTWSEIVRVLSNYSSPAWAKRTNLMAPKRPVPPAPPAPPAPLLPPPPAAVQLAAVIAAQLGGLVADQQAVAQTVAQIGPRPRWPRCGRRSSSGGLR